MTPLTDDDGFLTPTGVRWLVAMAIIVSLVGASVMENNDRARAARVPRPVPATVRTVPLPSSSTTPTTEASTPPPRPTDVRAGGTEGQGPRDPRPAPPSSLPPAETVRMRVESTVYCVSGVTYSGGHTHPGVVAVNRDNGEWSRLRGTRWRVLTGPHAGRVYTVEDAGPAAHFDMYEGLRPDCRHYALDVYGRKAVTIERLPA